jgi:hypothetical protein
MKRVLAGLAGAIALAGMSSMGIAGPRKNRAARRQAEGTTTESHASSARHAAGCHAPVKRPAAAQRSRPQPLAAAQAAERKRAQQGQGVDRKDGQQSRQAQDKRAQEKVLQRQAKPAAKTVGAVRIRAGRDFEPVFLMMAARWLSTVRWLIPRSAEMFLLGSQARTRSKIWC